ncbi:hypothetical protein FMO003_28940 [Moritella sp. F3]|nr:hypothetical protein FMO001_27120 [Moritella sp. F1]GIC82613.1 hypothetical protein FMO003_28940 [Moritella sp. F3]
MPVIKNPEMTKKISTPAKPPGAMLGLKWNNTTAINAIALNPFKSHLKFNLYTL